MDNIKPEFTAFLDLERDLKEREIDVNFKYSPIRWVGTIKELERLIFELQK